MKWHKGPPPSVGWWPASRIQNDEILRWWDGAKWSVGIKGSFSANSAARYAAIAEDRSFQAGIEWTDRPASWPARSKT